MEQRELSVLMAALFVTSLVTGIVTASPPQPSTDGNGLSENESAILWSRDTDNYTSQEEYRQRYGDERTAIHQIANGTDITFKRPPATAATWTRNDFEDLEPGDLDTSVHPPHASLEDGVFIEDAHATVFAVQPSTRGHLESGETPLFIAPNGTMRGFVDYRVRVPNGSSTGNRTGEWSLTEHEIEEVRLQKDGETIARTDGSHTPAIDYQIDDDWSATLTLEAEIHVRLKKTRRTDMVNGTDVVYREETRNVSDSIDVEIYDLSAYPYYAEYPNGDAGVAIFQSRPWQGYTLTDEGNASVCGVWRLYTARNTNWDTLVRSNRTDSAEVESDAIPVYVHAYPSRIGPRAEPVWDGPEIIDTWGTERPSPRETIGENVSIEVVNQSYETTYGVAVRAENVDPLHVAGIVRGVNASIVEPDTSSERQLRRSNLTVEVLQQNESQATLRIELRDHQTGTPIVLNDSARRYPIGDSPRDFLSRALDVMNRDDGEYTLLDSMRALRDEFEELNLQRLTDQNLVEEASACGRKYYTVLPAGRELLGEKLQVGPGLGDIEEKTPHKVGVRLLERWVQQQDDVAHVEPYYEHDDYTVFDVAGCDADGELVWVGEAELPSNNTHAPIDDYDKLRSIDADAIWAFNNRETAVEVLDRLADADRVEESVSGRDARSFSTIQDAVADFDAAGMTTVRGFKNLDQEVNR